MKEKLLIWSLIFFSQFIFCQKNNKTYLTRNHNYGTTYSYDVTEIIIHSDSSYTRRNWNMLNKKEWKNYKEYKPELSEGKISFNGKNYVLNEYRNGNKTDFSWNIMLTEKKLIYFYFKENGGIEKGIKFRRIKRRN
ncbi:MAG: hypothetical protein ACPGU6_01435 [Tenacibaculum sp.]